MPPMPPIFQFLLFLGQMFPVALKAWKTWQQTQGEIITRQKRKELASDIKSVVETAVETKSVDGLEEKVKNLGRPAKALSPDSKSPS